MSSIVSFLQNELLSLSSEAKKRHPDIKESSERVILILRPLKDLSVTDICTALSKSDEIMTPFFLALDTKQPKLVSIAVGSLQRLVSHKAISDDQQTLQKLIKALADVTSVSMDVQVKSLQILLPLLTQYQNLHLTLIADILNLCFQFCNMKDALVSSLAAATLQQLVIFLFDKVSEEDVIQPSITSDLGSQNTLNSLQPFARDAYLVFQDLCELANSLNPQFLNIHSIPRAQCLELLESILQNHHAVFDRHAEFRLILTKSICPMVINTFLDRSVFANSVRLNRLISILIHKFHTMLIMECEVFISLFLKVVNDDVDQFFTSAAMVMEILHSICSNPKLLISLFSIYDSKSNGIDVVQSIVSCFHKIITNSHATLLSSANVKVLCIDMLDKNETPVLPDDYLVYLAVQSTFALIHTLHDLPAITNDSVALVNSIWSAQVSILSHLLKSPMASETVASITQFIVVCDKAQCTESRNTSIQLLGQCVTCTHVGDPITVTGGLCLQATLACALDLVNSLDTQAWLTVFEVAVHADRIKLPRHVNHPLPVQSKIASSAPSHLGSKLPSAFAIDSTDVNAHIRVILDATRDLPGDALEPIFGALCQLNSIPAMSFAIDKLRDLVILHIHRLITELTELWTLVMQHFVFTASTTQSIELQLQACDNICHVATHAITHSQAKALAPLHDLAALSGDVPKRALQTLHSILQVHGQVLTEWMQVYAILQNAANEEYLVRVSFPSLELICTEYLPTPMANGELDKCIATLRIYALQSVDVNISLTCIRLLWTIADSTASRQTHWLTVLQQLTLIGKDRRPQVRNGCIASLFRAIASSGKRLLKENQWHACVHEVILPVLKSTLQCNDAAPQQNQVMQHHARDTSEKQWDETRVLAVQGLQSVLSLDMCVSMLPTHLCQILDTVVQYVLETALEVKLAALVLLHQLAKYNEAPTLLYAFVYDSWTCIVHGLVLRIPAFVGLPKSMTISHDFLLVLVHIIKDLPAPLCSFTNSNQGLGAAEGTCITTAYESRTDGSEPEHVLVPTVISLLEVILLQLLAVVPDHPNDCERMSLVQSTIIQVVHSFCIPETTSLQIRNYDHILTMVQLLCSVSKLPMSHQGSNQKLKYPAFLAVAREAMTRQIDCIRTCIPVVKSSISNGVDPHPPNSWIDQVITLTISGIEPYLMITHALHDHAVHSLLEFVQYYFPINEIPKSHKISDHIQQVLIQTIDRFLVTRPKAFQSNEESDIKALDLLVGHIPPYIAPTNFNLMIQAIELSTRIEANSVLDASISHAVHTYIAERELALRTTDATTIQSPPASPIPQQLPPLPPSIPSTPIHQPSSIAAYSPSHAPLKEEVVEHQSQMYCEPVRQAYFSHAIHVLFAVAAKYPECGVPIVIDRVILALSTFVTDRAQTRNIVPLDQMRIVEVETVLDALIGFIPSIKTHPMTRTLYLTLVDAIVRLKDDRHALQSICECLRVLAAHF